ncbi:MAG: hypothetical protein ACREV1_13295 [Gammaproteobacteria bacterium]
MAGVIYDFSFDPTASHNLWPFEIIIAPVLGFSASLLGALLGGFEASVIRRVTANRGGT